MNILLVGQSKVNPMNCWREPSLEDILSDPITQAVISADGVDASELDAMLRRVAQKRRSAERGIGAAAWRR
jgi:hypothetical protein